MLRKAVLREIQGPAQPFRIARDFSQNRRCADFATRLSLLTTACEGIGSGGQRLPSISTNSGTTGRAATARCIASMVACRIFSSSISCGSAHGWKLLCQHFLFDFIEQRQTTLSL